jgi:hypothetical protein
MALGLNNNLDGNIHDSLEHNAKRFKVSDQMVRIFENTAKWLEEYEEIANARSTSGSLGGNHGRENTPSAGL